MCRKLIGSHQDFSGPEATGIPTGQHQKTLHELRHRIRSAFDDTRFSEALAASGDVLPCVRWPRGNEPSPFLEASV
jgi:hypothetical protein